MDKLLILSEIKNYYSFKSDTKFADFLGITPQVLSNWKNRNTFDIELVYTKCLIFNSEWLLTGKGEMLKKTINENIVNEPIENYGLDYKEMYLDAKYTIEVQKKYIESLEVQLNTKRKAG